MSKTVMISLPMAGRTDEEIKADFERAGEYLKAQGFEVVMNSIFDADWIYREGSGIRQPGLWYLGNALIKMSFCDAVYFMNGWENARGCQIEHSAAEKYGLELIYEA